MPLAPTIVPNARHDVVVTSPEGEPRRQTIYSGQLLFGPPAARGTMMAKMDFAGLLWLPDSLSYDAGQLASAVLAADLWIASTGDGHCFVPQHETRFEDHPQAAGIRWVTLGLSVQGYSGTILGYRVTATCDPVAIR